MTGSFLVREAIASDLPGLLELYRHLNPNSPEPDPAEAEAAWAALLGSGMTRVFVGDLAGSLVCTCILVIVPNLSAGARPYSLIENVVTLRDYRRRGFGRAVLASAVEAAWAAGCYKVMLATGSKQEATLRFYEGAGFRRDAKTFFEARQLVEG